MNTHTESTSATVTMTFHECCVIAIDKKEVVCYVDICSTAGRDGFL